MGGADLSSLKTLVFSIFTGNPATLAFALGPVALRPIHSDGLPFSVIHFHLLKQEYLIDQQVVKASRKYIVRL